MVVQAIEKDHVISQSTSVLDANAAVAPMLQAIRSNSELLAQLGLVVARANQTMAARQAAVITEAMDDLNTLFAHAMPNASDPSASIKAYNTYLQSAFRRAVAQLNFSVDNAAEMSKAALELAQNRMMAEPGLPPSPANGKFSAGKK